MSSTGVPGRREGNAALQVRMPAEHRTMVAAVAQARGVSVSELVRIALVRLEPEQLALIAPEAVESREPAASKPPPPPPRKKRRRR